MILPDCNGFPRTGRIIAFDWGARRTGVAVSDISQDFIFTRPAIILRRGDDNLAKKMADMAAYENAVGIVIGLPVHMDGTESETTASVRRTATELCTYSDLPIIFIEENLTSLSAQESMGKVRISDIKQRLDSESARVILENAIAILRRAQ